VERISSVEEMWQATEAVRHEGKVVGLVPTMGALHEGHMSLVRAACERSDVVAVSIFVNPTQFAPGEDYERYPRDLEGDMALLAAEGVDLVFTPSVGTMYAEGDRTVVDPGPLGGVLCGQRVQAAPGVLRRERLPATRDRATSCAWPLVPCQGDRMPDRPRARWSRHVE